MFAEIETQTVDIIAKGGRGKKAPYNTTHHRIPEPIKPLVEKLAAAYRSCFQEGSEQGTKELLERVEFAIIYDTSLTNTSSHLQEKPVNNYHEIRDRILKKTRSDKLKTVAKALDDFIMELEA